MKIRVQIPNIYIFFFFKKKDWSWLLMLIMSAPEYRQVDVGSSWPESLVKQ